MGPQVRLVNPAYETAIGLRGLLEEHGLRREHAEPEEFPYRFFVSDLAEKFQSFANSILPYNVKMTQKVDIEKY